MLQWRMANYAGGLRKVSKGDTLFADELTLTSDEDAPHNEARSPLLAPPKTFEALHQDVKGEVRFKTVILEWHSKQLGNPWLDFRFDFLGGFVHFRFYFLDVDVRLVVSSWKPTSQHHQQPLTHTSQGSTLPVWCLVRPNHDLPTKRARLVESLMHGTRHGRLYVEYRLPQSLLVQQPVMR